VRPAVRAREVHDLAGSKEVTQRARRLFVDRGPRLAGNRSELAQQINELGVNEEYLPGIRLPEGLRATDDLAEAMEGAEVCVMGVPSHGWREILQEITPHLAAVDAVVSLTKGLEVETNRRMSEVLAEVCPGLGGERFAIPQIASVDIGPES
jgi:glycerol-3-phosphate dehydrogenase (NAD(P)+)